MSGLLFKFAQLIARQGRKKITHDIAHTSPVPKWTHADKIRELKTDEYVSGEYLAKLINASRKKTDLNEIAKYLVDKNKVANLKPSELAQLKAKLTERMDLIDMKALLKHFRENGSINFADWFDLFL
jgi:Ca2+-binding EF-hand superfamily protein